MILGPARPEDVAEVSAIEQRTFSDPWSAASFRGLIGAPQVLFATAREGAGAPVLGYVVAIFAGDEGEIANLAVAGDARGKGIGSALVEAALVEAKRRDVAVVYLEVRESNAAARSLYAARGFEEVGRRKRYYQHPAEDALILRRPVGPRLK